MGEEGWGESDGERNGERNKERDGERDGETEERGRFVCVVAIHCVYEGGAGKVSTCETGERTGERKREE